MQTSRALAATLSLLAVAGCSRSRDESEIPALPPAANSAAGTGVVKPGDIAITSTDRAITLGLAGDSVYVRLGDSVLKKVSTELDTNTVSTKGFGGSIEKLVKGKVSKMLNMSYAVPLADVDSAYYADGAIHLDVRGRKGKAFQSMKTNNRSALESFGPADAERFVTAVNAAKAKRR